MVVLGMIFMGDHVITECKYNWGIFGWEENLLMSTPFSMISWIIPLTLESDQLLISPYNVTPESNIKVTRIKEMITNLKSSWFLNKFSLSALQEMYREQYGEYAFWC